MAFVAPVAGTAGRAAAGRAAGRRAAAKSSVRAQVNRASSPISTSMTADEVNEELQHRRQVAAAARENVREAADDDEDQDDEEPAAAEYSDRGRRFDRMEPASSGAGFVLGVLVWTVAVNFMHGGMPQVRQLLRAKFLNQTGGS